MSTCDCPKQDGYANCCGLKAAKKRCESLCAMIDNRNVWLKEINAEVESLRAERDAYLEALTVMSGCVCHCRDEEIAREVLARFRKGEII